MSVSINQNLEQLIQFLCQNNYKTMNDERIKEKTFTEGVEDSRQMLEEENNFNPLKLNL